jgi:VWFA-related protein
MKRRALLPLFLLLVPQTVAGLAGHTAGQSTPDSTQAVPVQGGRFGARTEAVVVDVTVVDKKGRPVTTLTQSDFEVFEDNVPQTILGFERQAPNPNVTKADAAVTVGLGPKRSAITSVQGPSITALAFDRLSPEARMLAYRAAKRFVERKQADEFAGVFIVDQALRTLAPYTTDSVKLAAAVDQAGEAASTQLAHERTMADQITVTPETPYVASAEDQGRSAGQQPGTDPLAGITDRAELAIAAMILRMENSYRDMLYEMQGHAAVDALLALIDSMSRVPGRKAVIYFCEGLTIPPSVEPRFRSIIHTANRSNVTVYTVDAAGLRVHSDQMATAMAVTQYGAQGVGDVPHGDKFLQELEDNERTLKQDPAVSLGILAEQTGGLLINNTNDLASGIGRINDDRRNYYLLSYSSTNPALDGRFHRISVKVKKAGMYVRNRTGYIASPLSEAGPVNDFEAPALAALNQAVPPSNFDVQLVPAHVPEPGHPGRAVISVSIPGRGLALIANREGNSYAGGAVVVVRIQDDQGVAIQKLSQQYRLRGELADMETMRGKQLTFTRFPELSAGTYRVEVAVYDSVGERSTVATAPLTIHPVSTPAIGNLLIIDHAEKIDSPELAEQVKGNPLVASGMLLKPMLRPVIRRSQRDEITFAIPLSLEPNQLAPQATLGLVANGQVIATKALGALGIADSTGRLVAVGRMPLAQVPAGQYQLQLTIGTGPEMRTRMTPLTIVD